MNITSKSLLSALLTLLITNATFGQQLSSSPEKATTKVEELINKGGTVIIEGFTEIGSVTPLVSGLMTIQAAEYFIPTTNTKVYGVCVNFKNGNTNYIDYEELDGVLAGLEYIDKINKSSVTKLDNVNAMFQTRGNLFFHLYTRDNGNSNLLVSGGRSSSNVANFRRSDLPTIRLLIAKAKEKLDSIK